jgi:hypothetical protein
MTTKTYLGSMLVLLILSATLSSAVVFLLQIHNKLTPMAFISKSSKAAAGYHIQGAKG